MLPKFHCNLNPPELFWEWLKRKTNPILTGPAVTLMNAVKDSVVLLTAKDFAAWARRCERYWRIYQLGLTAEYGFELIRIMTGHGGHGTAHGSHV
jgi:hypothetical protein